MSSRSLRNIACLLLLLLIASMALVAPASARRMQSPAAQASTKPSIHQLTSAQEPLDPNSDSRIQKGQTSHRLIVELNSAPLTTWVRQTSPLQTIKGRVDLQSLAAQSYLTQLRSEQATFVQAMRSILPSASVSTFRNENGLNETASYQLVFNGMSVDPGQTNRDQARKALLALPNVKNVYLDFAHATTLYTSTTLINAPA